MELPPEEEFGEMGEVGEMGEMPEEMPDEQPMEQAADLNGAAGPELAGQDADDEATLLSICEIVLAKPHLAQALAQWLIPNVTLAPASAITEKRFQGNIKRFDWNKSYGFIECADIKQTYGCDVWVHGAQIGQFDAGMNVSFAVLLNKEGKPQAFDLSQRGAQPAGAAAWGAAGAAAWHPMAGGSQLRAAVPPRTTPRPPGPAAARGPPNLSRAGAAAGAVPTMGVKRPAHAMASPGHAMARPAKAPRPAAMAVAAYGGGKGGKGKGGKGGWSDYGAGGGALPSKGPPQASDATRYVGTIKSFLPDKGFGFIESEAIFNQYGRDVWMHHKQMKEYTVGTAVSFTLALSAQGNPQAIDLEAADFDPGQAAAAADGVGGLYTGKIKSFLQERGYGFIECADLFPIYGRDVWFHHLQLAGFSVGDEVTFKMTLNKDGNPQAVDLTQ